MSWNFRSRKTSAPSRRILSTAAGPSEANKYIFILNMRASPESGWAKSNADSIEGESNAMISFWRARSLKDVSAPRVARFAGVKYLGPLFPTGTQPDRRHPTHGRPRRGHGR